MDGCPVVHCLTAWTSHKCFCECDGEMFSDRRDRVFDVTFGSDRRRRGVGNLWVTEASCAARRLRGESLPVRRQGSRKLRCRVSRGGENHANLDLRNGLIRVRLSAPRNRVRCASAIWLCRREPAKACPWARSRANISSAQLLHSAIQRGAIPADAVWSDCNHARLGADARRQSAR